SERADAIRRQLSSLTGADIGKGRRGTKGRKLPVKYRDRAGNTWSGRGATPRWMRDAIKKGAKRDDFLVGKGATPAKKAGKKTIKSRKRGKKRVAKSPRRAASRRVAKSKRQVARRGVGKFRRKAATKRVSKVPATVPATPPAT